MESGSQTDTDLQSRIPSKEKRDALERERDGETERERERERERDREGNRRFKRREMQGSR